MVVQPVQRLSSVRSAFMAIAICQKPKPTARRQLTPNRNSLSVKTCSSVMAVLQPVQPCGGPEDQRLDSTGAVQQIPAITRPVSGLLEDVRNRRRRPGAIHFRIDRMVGIEEVLAVITCPVKAIFQQAKHQLVRLYSRRTAQLREHRAVNAKVVIFEIITTDADGAFIGSVGHGVALAAI